MTLAASAGTIPHMADDSLYGRIKRRLDELRMNPRQASLAAGLGPDFIRNIASQKSRHPTAERLQKLAQVLKVDLGDLTGEQNSFDAGKRPGGPPTRSTVAARIRAARYAYKPDAAAFALEVGVAPAALEDIESGAAEPGRDFLDRFVAATAAPLDWIFLGRITKAMDPMMAARIGVFFPELVWGDPSSET